MIFSESASSAATTVAKYISHSSSSTYPSPLKSISASWSSTLILLGPTSTLTAFRPFISILPVPSMSNVLKSAITSSFCGPGSSFGASSIGSSSSAISSAAEATSSRSFSGKLVMGAAHEPRCESSDGGGCYRRALRVMDPERHAAGARTAPNKLDDSPTARNRFGRWWSRLANDVQSSRRRAKGGRSRRKKFNGVDTRA